eukprot:gb/GECG01001311.1/.p1 GENE.gb/GECG01001311.1/~~gb/GECG01001311.1/.p1  ORF type:complete len:737 (+),score=111.85 gb/GECG01001311.1/:1-2211(+)
MSSTKKTKISLRDIPRMDEAKMRMALKQLSDDKDTDWESQSRDDLASKLVETIKQHGNKTEVELPVEQIASSSSHNDARDDHSSSEQSSRKTRRDPYENGQQGEEDDEDVGPAVPETAAPLVKKRRKELPHENVYLESLPNADMYEKSYMHRTPVTHIKISHQYDFVITASEDGHLKFWKKMEQGVEFVKHFKSHLGTITDIDISYDGSKLLSVSEDCAMKIYDVINFDMMHMLRLGFVPSCAKWIYPSASSPLLVAVAARGENNIYIYDVEKGNEPISVVTLHSASVLCMSYNQKYNTVISTDARGTIEYWKSDTFEPPGKDITRFSLKMDTSLYALTQDNAIPWSISVSHDGERFVVTSNDRKIRVFKFRSGKLMRTYDESLEVYEEAQKASKLHLDDIDYGRRTAVERDMEESLNDVTMRTTSANETQAQSPDTYAIGKYVPPPNAIFDYSGHFVIYPTLLGIKVVNIETNKVRKSLGRMEHTERFLCVALYQGTPKLTTQQRQLQQKRGKLTGDALAEAPKPDATVFCAAFRKQRFYLFSRREPDEEEDEGRDVFNEKPSKEEAVVMAESKRRESLGTAATLHTTQGDIYIKLFPDEAPKAVENFCRLARSGYYAHTIFHRVIKGFMIQGGDPNGDGTGGESIWGGEFEDEFHRNLKHDRPFTVSMANAGPNTNGSQFFITTAPCPWLDNKHTIFGRVTKGSDTVTSIENVKVDKTDKPYEDIQIVNIDIKT